jgi:predicted ATP-dependent serine protease
LRGGGGWEVWSRSGGTSVRRIDGWGNLRSTSSDLGLIGRTRECRHLTELLDTVRDGESRVLVVRGEAGVGKSALLQHLVAAAGDFNVLRATGVESEIDLPFAALHQVCAPFLDRLDTIPEPQYDAVRRAFGLTTGDSPDRLLIGLAVLSLLSAASEDRPVLCVIDDARGSISRLRRL